MIEIPIAPRVQRLLERFPPTGNEITWYPNGADERSLLLWRYFQESPDEPLPLRYANGLAAVMRSIAIAIHDDELIVGEVGLEDVSLTHPDEFTQAQAYWRERTDAFNRSFSWHADEVQSGEYALSWKWTNRDGHAIPAFEKILAQGLEGLRQEAQAASESMRASGRDAGDRQVFWQAMVLSLQALSEYILRYADLARQLAHKGTGLERRRELLSIAETCEWIAVHPPRIFAEALQLIWFVHLGIKLDDGGVGHSFGRFDQYLYPYFRSGIDSGDLNLERAAELLGCFWVRLNRECDDIAHLSLGGQTPAGEDAANDLSSLCLQVERWVNRKQPNLSTRLHNRTKDSYWLEIAATLCKGAGHPAIFNDEVIIPGLLQYGFPQVQARDYAQVGCVETFLPGLGAPWTDCYLNLAKCLELALNDGCDLQSGVRLGPPTGDPTGFSCFDQLFQAYERQVEAAAVRMLSAKDEYDRRLSAHAPEPLNSAFIQDCLQTGLDATGGGARYLLTGIYGVGLGTTVDSLAALNDLVFESRIETMATLLTALKVDFKGHERLRQYCRRRAPKYGNDDDRADRIAVRVVESFGRQIKGYSDHLWAVSQSSYPGSVRKAYHYAMFGSVLSHTGMGAGTAASADGRLRGETLSDGGSSSQGCNTHGPTATLRSLAKPNYRLAPGGAAINLRLSPEHFTGSEGLSLLVDLLKTYFALGGEQLQINMVSRDTLQQAIEHPDSYRDLVVRVAGFTAYFVSLPSELQLEILVRA